MRAGVFFSVLGVVVLGSVSASAHFKLEQPADWLVTNSTGDPMGATGTQKMNPCGDGTRSGLVTQVTPGSKVHVKLTETIYHPGHYRIALLPKYDPVSSDVPEPAVTLVSGQCGTAAIQSPVVAPVIADNLFNHAAPAAGPYETDVTMPNATGKYTLQILEFMSAHAPQCFYHHCAQLEVVSAEAGADGGSVVVGPDGGVVVDSGAGSSGSSGSSGAGSSGSSGSGGAGSSGASGAGPVASNDNSGCSTAGGAAPSLTFLGVVGVGLASMLRRRRAPRSRRG